MKQLIIAGLITLGLAASPAAARSLDDIISDGTIRIGVNPNFPPMSSYGDSNELEGFDIDIGRKLAEALGVEAEFVPTESQQRVPFIVSDRIDISMGALTRTVERDKLIDFTVPLHTEAMATLTTTKVTAESWKDLNTSDITLVNMRGNWSVDFLKEQLPEAKVLLVDTIADTVRAVAQGRGDAIVENIDFFMKFTENYPDVEWRVIEDTVFVGFCGIGVSQGNASLQSVLNIALYDLHSSGTINETWEKWYGAPMLKPVPAQPYF
ncbi:transporter substrate-binding domain-containing protein [Oricola sp.]|uniref:transporter substrate-binding domain-containing protein n=1 Tax=Oricola sp. TaxID=1979950 RepID=UPI0025E577C2|nr:transporter substrate-binding domain-containing protein [Oricola sp.]MCI5076622.1 transporter substrate-binding domain-containing protein [Oricola sp.]